MSYVGECESHCVTDSDMCGDESIQLLYLLFIFEYYFSSSWVHAPRFFQKWIVNSVLNILRIRQSCMTMNIYLIENTIWRRLRKKHISQHYFRHTYATVTTCAQQYDSLHYSTKAMCQWSMNVQHHDGWRACPPVETPHLFGVADDPRMSCDWRATQAKQTIRNELLSRVCLPCDKCWDTQAYVT